MRTILRLKKNKEVKKPENIQEPRTEEKKEPEKETSSFSYEDDITKQIIHIIKEEGGRTTQKLIRKKIPLSEAKISLAITELVANGKIKKIKKGRGNIIILN